VSRQGVPGRHPGRAATLNQYEAGTLYYPPSSRPQTNSPHRPSRRALPSFRTASSPMSLIRPGAAAGMSPTMPPGGSQSHRSRPHACCFPESEAPDRGLGLQRPRFIQPAARGPRKDPPPSRTPAPPARPRSRLDQDIASGHHNTLSTTTTFVSAPRSGPPPWARIERSAQLINDRGRCSPTMLCRRSVTPPVTRRSESFGEKEARSLGAVHAKKSRQFMTAFLSSPPPRPIRGGRRMTGLSPAPSARRDIRMRSDTGAVEAPLRTGSELLQVVPGAEGAPSP